MKSFPEYYLFSDTRPHRGKSTRIQKGLILSYMDGEADICEEGVGFGLPVVQYRRDFYFPGTSRVSKDGKITEHTCTKEFNLDLIERSQTSDSKLNMFSWSFQRVYNFLYKAGLDVVLTPIVEWIVEKRERLGIKSRKPYFFSVKSRGTVVTRYDFTKDRSRIDVSMDFGNIDKVGIQQVFISTELGGTLFDEYIDSNRLHLKGSQIGTWEEVSAKWAVFYAPSLDFGFRIDIPSGTTAFRGREVIRDILSWTGLILAIPGQVDKITYSIQLGEKSRLLR